MAELNEGVTAACSGFDADSVKEIIDTDLSDARINNFINMAYFVTIPLSGELGDCGGGDALCEIMRLLSAHFLTIYERQIKSTSIGGEYSITYLGIVDEGLRASLYGQQAIAMDCSGWLAKRGLKRATFQTVDYETLDDLTDKSD